jgi:hypothetical protein
VRPPRINNLGSIEVEEQAPAVLTARHQVAARTVSPFAGNKSATIGAVASSPVDIKRRHWGASSLYNLQAAT